MNTISKGTDTGLVDIDGKPILVGDLVCFPYINPMGREELAKPTDELMEIRYDHGNMVAASLDPEEPHRTVKLSDRIDRDPQGIYICNYGTFHPYSSNKVHCWKKG